MPDTDFSHLYKLFPGITCTDSQTEMAYIDSKPNTRKLKWIPNTKKI